MEQDKKINDSRAMTGVKPGKRLLMISTDRRIFENGSAVSLRQLEYARDWDEVHIIVFTRRGFSEKHVGNNVWAYPTRSLSRYLYPFNAIRLGRFIISRRQITDISCQDPSLTAMAGVSLKSRFDLPLEIQIHEDIGSPNYGYTLSRRIRKAMALSYLKKADHIRVVSARIKDFVVRAIGMPEDRIEIRPIKTDVSDLVSVSIEGIADLHRKYPRFKKIVLMASRLGPEKDIGLAIKAWPHVLKKLPEAGLVIVGDGREKHRLQALVRRMGLKDSIIFERWTDRWVLASYYRTADLFLLTSLFEGYGMSLDEASAFGKKIVSTDVGIAREVGATIIDDSKKSPEEVASVIISALSTG